MEGGVDDITETACRSLEMTKAHGRKELMKEDDDNIAKVQDDGKQKITGKFQRETDKTGTKPRTSQDRHKSDGSVEEIELEMIGGKYSKPTNEGKDKDPEAEAAF